MKKTLALLLTIVMLISMAVCVNANQQFTDLSANHWAYANIKQLVAEGTIKGYPDGSFRPESLVTRAEFAKMFGEGTNKKTGDFKDLTSAHWSYNYVMASGVDADKEYFRPDEYMTRGEVLDALWDRCGVKVNAKAPGVITRQFADQDAVTWAYTTQLIKGNDGVDLRLSDTITRAEVTALILRVRSLDTNNLKTITDNISDKLILKMTETLDIFDREYVADSKLTNGEVAHAVMVLAYGTDQYAPAAHYAITYDGEYNIAMSCMTSYVWDETKNTQEFAQKNSVSQDALLAVMNAVATSLSGDIPVGNDMSTYSDAKTNSNFMADIYLTYAYNNGIFNTIDGTLKPDNEITMKDFLSLIIQADRIGGFTQNIRNGKIVNSEILKDSSTYPINYKDYGVILSDVPAYVYDYSGLKLPKDDYYEVNSFISVIKAYLNELMQTESVKTAYKISYTYYPSMTSIMTGDIQFVLKLEFDNVAQGTTFASVLPASSGNTQLIEENKKYYVLVSAGAPFSDYIPVDNTRIVNIIASY